MKRAFIGVGVGEPGESCSFPELPGVARDLDRLRGVFAGALGYDAVELSAAGNLDLSGDQIRQGLIAWREQTRGVEHDAVVLYFSGHADVHDSDLLLCTRGSVDGVPGSALDVRAIAQCLDGASDKLWIILDVCYAGAGAEALASLAARAAQEEGRALWFLASSGGRVRSYDGLFSAAFERASAAAPESFDTFRAALQRELDAHPAGQHAQTIAAANRAFDLLLSPGAVASREQRIPPRSERPGKRGRAWLLALAALAVLLAGAAALELSGGERADALAIARSGVPFDVAVLAERGGELVAVSAGEPVYSGERFAFHVKLPEAAYVGVLTWSANGKASRLYPGASSPHLLRVERDVRTRVPPEADGDLELDHAQGTERFAVFASDVALIELEPDAIADQLRARMPWPSGWDQRVAASGTPAATPARARVRGTFFRPREQRAAGAHIIAAALIELEHVD